MNTTKICNGILCKGEILPLTNFGLVKGKPRSNCKKCKNEESRLYYLNNKTKVKEKDRKYRMNNKEKEIKRHKKYYKNNKEKISEKAKKHRHIHRKRLHDEQQLKLQNEDNYIRYLLVHMKAKYKKKKRKFNLDFEYVKELQRKQNNKCVYSGKELVWKNKCGIDQGTIDRIDSSKGHIKGNCQLVTIPVNHFKLDLSHKDFLKLIETIKNKKTDKSHIVNTLNKKEYTKIKYMFFDMKKRQKIYNIKKYKQYMKECKFTDSEIDFFMKFYKPDSYIDFDLKYLKELCKNNNVCCISQIKISWEANNLFLGSIDRIDSRKPYSKDNIQITSWYVNCMKKTLSTKTTLNILNGIINNYGLIDKTNNC
jgi:hypothetical protein